jgi:mono/diheme cytochrome c family protein
MSRRHNTLFSILILLAVVPLIAADARSRSSQARAQRTVWDSVYTQAQASRGETAYAKSCARCHGASLAGGDESPALSGGSFLGNWNGLPVSDLHTRIKTSMPSDSVGIYDRQLVSDVIAYLFKVNGFPAGPAELSKDLDPLKEITIRSSRPD